MGWTSLDDFIQEVTVNAKFNRADWNKTTGASAYTAGHWYDLSQLAGLPVANTYSGTALAAQVPTDTTGFGLYHGGNVSTDTKHILNIAATTSAATGVPGVLMLVDMCLYYPGLSGVTTGAQTLTNATTLTRYTTGAGLRMFMCHTAATTGTPASTPVITMSYTNQAGTAGRALGATVNATAGAAATAIPPKIIHSGVAANNYGPFLPLASGDTGVRSVQTVTLTTAYTTATVVPLALVLAKPLATLPITTVSVCAERDLMNQLPSLPQVQDGACLTWLYYAGAATAASTNIFGNVDLGWG